MLGLLAANQARATDYNWSTGSNNAWDNNGRWSGGSNRPDGNDDRAFFSDTGGTGSNCTGLNGNITVGSLLSGRANQAIADYTATLTIEASRTLTVSRNGGLAGDVRWATGNLTVNGTIIIRGNLLFSSSGDFLGTGTIRFEDLGNAISVSLASSKTIPGTLVINKDPSLSVTVTRIATAVGGEAGSTTVGSQDLTVTNLTIQSGTLVVPANTTLTIEGNFNMSGGALDASAAGAAVVFRGNTWARTGGTITGPVTFAGTSAQSINSSVADDFTALTIDKTAGTVSLLAGTTVTGNLHVSQGTLAVNGQTLTVSGTTEVDGTLDASAASSAVVLSGDFLGASTGTVNVGARAMSVAGATADFSFLTDFTWTTGTLTLDGTSNPQTFTPKAGQALGALVISKGAAAQQVDLAGAVGVASVTVVQGVLALGGNQLSASGAATIDGTGTVTVGASGVLQVDDLTVNGLLDASDGAGGRVDVTNSILNGSGTITMGTGRLEVFNDADLSGQAAVTFVDTGVLALDGDNTLASQDLTLSGAETLGSVEVTGTATSGVLVAGSVTTVGLGGSLSVSNGGSFTISGTRALSVTGAVTLGGATTAGTLVLGTGGANFDGSISAGSGGGTFNQSGAAITVAADLNLVGVTYSNPGAVEFDGAVGVVQTVTIPGTGATAFGAVTLNRTADTDVVQITSVGPNDRFDTTDVTVTRGTLDLQVNSRLSGGMAGLSIADDGRVQNSVAGKKHEFLSAGATNSVTVADGGEFVFSGNGTELVFAQGKTVRVQGSAVFSADGAGGTITLTDQTTDNANWVLHVDAGVSLTVDRALIEDSQGAGATPLLATASTLDAETIATNTWIVGRVWLGGGVAGDWSDDDNWSGGVAPSGTEAAVFNAASNATLDGPPTENAAAISPIGGLVVFPAYTGAIEVDGDLVVDGVLSFDGSGGAQVLLGTNLLTVNGTSASITGAFGGGTSGGRLRLGATGAVQLALGAATTIDAALEVGSGDSGTLVTLTTANALDVDGLTVAHGGTTASSLTTNDAPVAIRGAATFTSTAGFVAGASQVSVSRAWSSGGGVSFTGLGRLTFDGAATQNLTVAASDAFRHVTLAGAGGVAQQAGAGLWTIPASLTLTGAGPLTLGGGGLNVVTAVTVDTTAAIGIDLNGAPATFAAGLTVNAGKTVRVNGGALMVQGAPLTGGGSVDGSGGGTVTVAAGLTVDGYTPGATLTFSGPGDWGTATDRSYGVVVVAPGNGNTVSIQGIVSVSIVDVQSGTLSVNGNRLDLEGVSVTPLRLSGGALTTTGTIIFQTTAADTQVPALTYDNLQLLGAVTHRPQGVVTAGGLTIGPGAGYHTRGPLPTDPDQALTVTGDAMVQGALTTGGGTGTTLAFGGDLNVGSGQLTATQGTVRFTAGGVLTLSQTTPSTFSALEVTGGARTVTSAAATPLTIGSTLAVSGGSLSLGANNQLAVTGAVSISGALTVGAAGASFGAGVSFGVSGARALTLDGTVTVQGGLNLANAQAFTQTGTLDFRGGNQTLTLSVPASTFGGSINVDLDSATDVLTVTGATWTVTGGVAVADGILDLSTSSIFGGVVGVAPTGTIQNTGVDDATHSFGAGVTIDGAFVFTATGLTLTFKEGETVTVNSTGTFTVQGAGGTPNTMQDEADDTDQWTLSVDSSASFTAQFLIIRDSAAAGTAAPLTADDSQDAGDNTGWTFPAKTTAWRSAIPGVWSLFTNWSNGVPNSGDTVVFDGGGIPAGNGNSTLDIGGLVLGQLTINGYTGTLNLGANSVAVTGETTVTTGTMNTGSSRLTTGSLVIDGGTVVAGSGTGAEQVAVDVTETSGTTFTLSSGTYDEGSGHTRVAGGVQASGGTWSNDTAGRLIFAGSGSSGSPQTWQGTVNLGEVRVDSGTATYVQLASSVTALRVEVTDAETLDVASFTLTVSGPLSVTGTGANRGTLVGGAGPGAGAPAVRAQDLSLLGTAIYTEGAGDTLVAGDLTVAAMATWAEASGVLVFDGVGGVGTEQEWSGSGAGASGVGAVRVEGGTATRVMLTGAAAATSLQVVASNTFLDGGQTLTVLGDGTATPLIVGGTFTGTGTTVFASAVDVTIPTTNATYGAVTVTGAAVYTFAGATTLGGGLTVNAAAATVKLGGTTQTAGVSVLAGALELSGFLLRTTAGLAVTGNGFVPNLAGTASVEFTGTGTWTGANVTTFGDVDVVGNAAVTLGSAVTVDSLDVTVGTAAIGLLTHKLTTRGGLTVVGTGFAPGTGSVDFTGTGTWSGANVVTFGNVNVIGSAAVTLGSAVTSDSLEVTAATASIDLDTRKLTTRGSLTVVGAGFDPGTGSVDFSGTGPSTWSGPNVASFGNVDVVGTGTVTLASSIRAASLDVTAGALNLGAGGPNVLTLDGNLAVAGNGFVPNNGRLVFAASATWTGAGVTSFGPVNVSGGAVTLGSNVAVASLTVDAGAEVTLSSRTLASTGALTLDGELDATAGSSAVSVGGAFAVSATGTITGTNLSTTFVAPGGLWTDNSPNPGQSFGAVTVSGGTVSATTRLTMGALTVQGSGAALTLAGQTTTNSVTVGTGAANTGTLSIGAGQLAVTGDVNVNAGGALNTGAGLGVPAVTLSVVGNLTVAGTFAELGAGDIRLQGDLAVAGATWTDHNTPGAGVVVFVGTGRGWSGNVFVGDVALETGATVTASTSVSCEALDLQGTGALTVGNNNTLTVQGDLNGATGTLTFNTGASLGLSGSANQAITLGTGVSSFRAVAVNKTGGTATVAGTPTWSLSGALTVQAGTLALAVSSTFGSTSTVDAGATLSLLSLPTSRTHTFTGVLTVHGTFLAAGNGHELVFRENLIPGVDVTSAGTFIIAGGTPAIILRDHVPGSAGTQDNRQWHIRVDRGVINDLPANRFSVSGCEIRQSQASETGAGMTILPLKAANTLLDPGTCENWSVTSKTTTWAGTNQTWAAGTWSDGAPVNGDEVFFDATSVGNSTYNGNPDGVSLTLLHLRLQAGYTGVLTLQRDLFVLNQLELLSGGTLRLDDGVGLYARGTSLTFDGATQTFSVGNGARLVLDGPGTIDVTDLAGAAGGCLPPLEVGSSGGNATTLRLQSDLCVAALNLVNGTVDLNGHVLHVKGDLSLASGTTWLSNGGELRFDGAAQSWTGSTDVGTVRVASSSTVTPGSDVACATIRVEGVMALDVAASEFTLSATTAVIVSGVNARVDAGTGANAGATTGVTVRTEALTLRNGGEYRDGAGGETRVGGALLVESGGQWTDAAGVLVFDGGDGQTWTDSTGVQSFGEVAVREAGTSVSATTGLTMGALTVEGGAALTLGGASTLGAVTLGEVAGPTTGTLNLPAVGTFTVSTGAVTILHGDLNVVGTHTLNTGALNVGDPAETGGTNGTLSSGDGLVSASSVDVNGTGTLTLGPGLGAPAVALDVGTSLTVDANGVLTEGAGWLQVRGDVTVAGTWNDAAAVGEGVLVLQGGVVQTVDSSADLGELLVTNLGTVVRPTTTLQAETIEVEADAALDLAANDAALTLSGELLVSGGTVEAGTASVQVGMLTVTAGAYEEGAGETTVSGDVDITGQGWVDDPTGTLVFGGGMAQVWSGPDVIAGEGFGAVRVQGADTQVIASSDLRLGDLTLSAAGLGMLRFAGPGTTTVDGTVTLTLGDLDLATNTVISGVVSIAAAAPAVPTLSNTAADSKTHTFQAGMVIEGEFIFTADGLMLVFAEGETVSVGPTGTFTVQGAVGSRNEVRDQSPGGGAPAGQWVLDLAAGGTIAVDLTNIRDSRTTGDGVPRTATNARDLGNNTGWLFAAKTTQWTGLAGAGDTNWSTDANWSNDAPGNGDTVEFPNPVGLVSTMDLPGLELKKLDVSGYTGGVITLMGALNVNHSTSTDPVNDGVFLSDGTLSLAGQQLTVSQRVSVSDQGLLALGTGALDASGDVLVTDSGSVTASAGGGMTFRGATQAWSGTATADFGRVTLTNGTTVTLGADVMVSNASGQTALQVADGATLALAGNQVEVDGDLLLGLVGSAGTLDATDGASNSRVRVLGDFVMENAGTQIISPADLTTTFAGGTTQAFLPLALDVGRVEVTGAGTQVDLDAALTCQQLVASTATARLVTHGFLLTVTGPAGISGVGSLDATGSIVATGGDMTIASFVAGASLTFNGAGGSWSGASSFGVVSIEADVTMASAVLASSVTIDTGATLSTGPNQLAATGLVSGAGALDASTGQVEVQNGLTVTAFTAGTLLTFSGDGTWSGASDFGQVQVVGTSTAVTLGSDVQSTGLLIDGGTLVLGGHELRVDGDLTLGTNAPAAGHLDATDAGGGSRIRVTGDYVLFASSTITSPGDLTTTFEGGAPQVFTPLAGVDMGNLAVSGASVQLQAGLTARALTLSGAASFDAATAPQDLTLAGAVDLSGGALLMAAGRSLTFAGTGARDLDPGANTFLADLQVSSGAAVNVVSNPLVATGSVTIAAGADLDLQADGNDLLAVTSPGDLMVSAATTVQSIDFTGGTLTLAAGAALTIESTTGAPLVGPSSGLTAGLGSTVILAPQAGAPNQVVRSLAYANLTLTNAAAPGVVFLTDTTQLTVGGALTVSAGTLLLGQNVNAGSIAGAGALDTQGLALTITAGSIANTVTLQSLTGGANLATVELLGASAIPDATFGHLILNAGGPFSLAGGPALVVYGNLLLQGGATFSGNPQLEFRGNGSVSFSVGVATLNLGGILVAKSGFADNVTITGGLTSNLRSVSGPVTVSVGTLTLGTNASFRFLQDTTVGSDPNSPTFQARLQVQGNGVVLQVGDGTGSRTLRLHDIMNVGNGNFANIQLVIGANDRILLTASKSVLNLNGAPSSKLQIDSTDLSDTNPLRGRIAVDPVTGVNAQINATDVSVRANDASGVVNSLGQQRPIQAVSSVDRGENLNWTFEGGGSLVIEAATALGDGNGRLNRLRLVYSRALNFSTIGSVHQQFSLRRVASDGSVLASVAGTSANAVQTTAGRSIDIVFGTGLAQTDLQGVQVVYTPPTTSFLQSTDGVPALQTQTLVAGGSVPLVDGAAPALVSSFAQDIDGNGGLDRIVFFFSEPVAFTPAVGTSVSAFDPVTDTAALALTTQLTLQIAGEAPFTIDLTSFGARQSGAGIAQVIQQLVREQLDIAPPAGHDPLRRPAYRNFTAQFIDGRYLLRAGVPLRFDAGSSTYQPDFAASTVQVVAGPLDAAPLLRLGSANGGMEQPGRGDARAGYSASSGAGSYNLVGTTARLRINGEDFREYPLTSSGLSAVAVELETLVRNTDNQARHPPNQDAYSQFVAIPDGGRLVLVSGTYGSGSAVVVNSDPTETFSSIAQIGTSQFAQGARESVGAANTVVSLGDLAVRSQAGANLLLGRSTSDMLVNGSTVSVELANLPGTGTGAPTYLWSDDGDLAFLADRAPVPNLSTQRVTNLAGTSNVVLVGDANGDLRLGASPDARIAPGSDHRVDASGTIPFAGSSGVTVTYDWTFISGPATPSNVRENGPVLLFDAVTAGTYRFQVDITVLDAGGNPVPSIRTDSVGCQTVFVEFVVAEEVPVALAGSDAVVIGSSVQLDGSQSYDPNGGIGTLEFQWTATDSSGIALNPAVVFDDGAGTSMSPVFTPGAPGTYTLTLVVSKIADPTLTASDSVTITLSDPNDLLPTADAGPDQVARVGARVTLDGLQSRDPEGAPLTYQWRTVASGAPITLSDPFSAQPTFLPTVPGAYVFELIVAEGATLSAPDQVTVLVIDDSSGQPRRAPAAAPRVSGLRRATFLTSAPTLTQSVVVVLEDGTERAVELIDLASSSNDDPSAAQLQGLARVDVIVGDAVFASLYVRPRPGDADPVEVVFGALRSRVVPYGIVSEAFVLDGSRSVDDGVLATYTWRQVSGPFRFNTRDGSLVAVVPQVTGTYVFELTVTDTIGLTSLPNRVVVPVIPQNMPEVGPPAARVAVGSAGVPVHPADEVGTAAVSLVATVAGPNQTVTFDASSSTSRNAGALTYAWRQVAGPTAVLTNTTSASLAVQPKSPGAYAFEVTVTDENLVSDMATVWLTVAAPGKAPPVARIAEIEDQAMTAVGSLRLTLTGDASSGAKPLQFLWSQTRGFPVFIEAQGTRAELELSQPGDYEFTLRISDGEVTSAPAVVSFAVIGGAEARLASGASTSKSSGGCAMNDPGRPDASGVPWVAALFLALASLRLAAGQRRGGRRER